MFATAHRAIIASDRNHAARSETEADFAASIDHAKPCYFSPERPIGRTDNPALAFPYLV